MLNFWRRYPRRKPKKEGWYSCTVRYFDGEIENRKVMDLYYIPWANKWYDERRYSVFKGYTIYLPGRGQLEGNRVFDDRLCDLTDDVLSWKKLSKVFSR